MNVPEDLSYARTHEWLRMEGADGTVGITDHAQAELTDVVYVELPEVGKTVNAGEQICVVESVKAASDIYAPASGTISAVNTSLKTNPASINTDPYGEGWLVKIRIEAGEDLENLQSPAQYRVQLGGSSEGGI